MVTGFGGWTSINYFVFPAMIGVEEYEALRKLIKETGLVIQWRRFHPRSDWYWEDDITETVNCWE